jgi:tryptophanyl-tRNA synthetase
MSKSENQMNTLYLADEDDVIVRKIKRATTDAGPLVPNAPMPPYIENLFTLMGLVSSPDTVEKFKSDYNNSSEGNCIIRYGDLKKQLAEDMAAFIKPIREKAADLQKDTATLQKIMKLGAEKAGESASKTLTLVRSAIGMNYY